MPNIVVSTDPSTKGRLCPYCKHEFPDKLKRNRKCPQCGKPIIIRQGIPLTEDEAKIRDWLQKINWLGVSRRAFDEERRALSERFGVKASINDTLWSLLNTMVVQKQGDDQQQLYYHMADIVRTEGKDPNPYIETAIRLSLQGYQRDGVQRVEITGANDNYVCPTCKRLYGMVFTIQEALRTMPIPMNCSSKYGCRCVYAPVIDW